jgi:hypothetical protein
MHTPIIPLRQRLSLRERARLNAWIAKDLSDHFGGTTADYLRPLNHKLKEEIRHHFQFPDDKAALAA